MRTPPTDEECLRRLLDALLSGLEHVHNADVLHRDIKPSNILIRPDGTPVLIDFGSSRRASGNQDLSKYVQLTPAFAPPEQRYGQYGKWTDIYSLAATLFHALTGRKPDPDATVRSRLADELKGRYTDSFLQGLDAALELNYRERPQSVAEWRSVLGLGSDHDTEVPPETQHEFPSDDSDATVVIPRPGPDQHQPAGQAATPTVILSTAPEPTTASRPLAVDPPRPQPAIPDDEPRSEAAGWLKTHWLSALSLAVAAGILVMLIWLRAGLTGGGPPKSTTEDGSAPPTESEPGQDGEKVPEPPPPPPTVEERISAVLKGFKGFDCTPLRVERRAEGGYAISGYVAGRADLDQLGAKLGAIPRATIDLGGVALVPRPLCPLLGLVSRYATEQRLTIAPNHPDGRYTTGDDFGVTFHNTDRSSGRLHAFYIDSKGKVYAPPETFDQFLYVGAETGLTGYQASAPGTDLVLALWCRGVALPQPLAQQEQIGDFLPALDKALRKHASDCGATWRFIEIR